MAHKGFRITYATMSADNEELHAAYEQGIEIARSWLGRKHPFYVNGEPRQGTTYEEQRSPIDTDILLGSFAQGGVRDVSDAVAAARAFSPDWSRMPWQERVRIMRRAADAISDRVFELAALMAIEVGKSRLEALGDVEETADLIRYYCKSMEDHDGFQFRMDRLSEQEDNRSVLRPYGVWAVISPFNFPMALAGGPAGGALVAGNTVVLKPSHQGCFSAHKLYEALRVAGVPAGAFHLITGPGSSVGKALFEHADVGGVTFTGSYEVGMQIYKNFATAYPKPAICEMGGKNPAVVTAKADLEKAAEGIMRSAFGYSGQKCSACSRVYVEGAVYDRFIQRLIARASKLTVGNPLERQVYTGPVINAGAVATFEKAVADVQAGGGRVLLGGGRISEGDLRRGHFVQPTIVEAPLDHRVWKDELFVPFVAVAPVDSLGEAITLANDTVYGLTAGLFSEDRAEIERFLHEIQAGVVYVNRRAGATTGAWPGMQPFGGWKGSGTTGKAGGGLHYVQQYLREQSRAIVGE
ncbi:MAG TPA: aldehyde dehydrogenase family protein [Candidatus Methylomirabilis sp.]|nr:aldehyde dehydrogenase family protein [Candidatus Methylomirabilis sp.]